MYGVELYAAVRLAVVDEGLSHHYLIVIYQGGVVESTMELGWELDMVGRVRFVVIVTFGC